MSTIDSHTEAFLLIEVPTKRSGDVVERLIAEHSQYAVEAHALWGEADVIARVAVPSTSVLADLIMQKIQLIEPVQLTRTFIVIEGMRYRSPLSEDTDTIKGQIEAFVFINVEAARTDEIARLMVERFSGQVLEAHAVWGDADVILKVSVPNIGILQRLIMENIQQIQYVSVTRTHIVIPEMSKSNRNLSQIYDYIPLLSPSEIVV